MVWVALAFRNHDVIVTLTAARSTYSEIGHLYREKDERADLPRARRYR
jgi:hypothetical protein